MMNLINPRVSSTTDYGSGESPEPYSPPQRINAHDIADAYEVSDLGQNLRLGIGAWPVSAERAGVPTSASDTYDDHGSTCSRAR